MNPDKPTPEGQDPTPEELVELRRRAERRVEEEGERWSPTGPRLSFDEVRRVVHELRVYQIELEMQNEEMRRAQAELELSRERYFELYDLAPVAYFTLSESAAILEANLTAVRLLGEERSTLLRRRFTRYIHPESQDVYYRHRRTLFETGDPQTCEFEMRRADDTAFIARLVSTLARGDDGEPVHRTVVSDVTERRREEAERLALEHRVQQVEKAESLGRMAGAIAHHFNNLLGVTTGNLELRLNELPSGESTDEGLTDALSAARSAADMSRMLLTYLGQERGRRSPRSLCEICRITLPVLRAAAPRGTQLETDLPTPGPTVDVSDLAIPEVLRNLVANAWEASESGRTAIRIAVRTVAAADIPASARFPKGWSPGSERYALLAVTDEGSGIEGKAIESIFDPFFSSKSFGRGLGLSVTLGTVQAHDGAIVVRSAPERGTTFEIYLPALDRPAPDRAAPDAAIPRSMVGTVLAVDDDPMIRSLTTRMLERLGFDVLTAADGVVALEVFDAHAEEIVCVVCDLTMPRMDGWETLAALRERRPGLPVVLASGYDRTYAMSGGGGERPQAFLSKPWDLAQFRDAIETALAG
ncbi:MAG: response regulator [Longimicrobiales bacterium]|nr:response regulator [Longimicrobiales bacterium]